MRSEDHPDHAHHGHDMGTKAQEIHDPAAHGTEPAPAAHALHPHQSQPASGHDKHADPTPAMFRDRFWMSLVFTLPILYFYAHFQTWFGYQAVQCPGVVWVQPHLSTVLSRYGSGVFVQSAFRKRRTR